MYPANRLVEKWVFAIGQPRVLLAVSPVDPGQVVRSLRVNRSNRSKPSVDAPEYIRPQTLHIAATAQRADWKRYPSEIIGVVFYSAQGAG